MVKTSARDARSGAKWPFERIEIGSRSRTRLGDIAGLMESINAVGLLHPIVVRADGSLVAGYRRLEAVGRLGWTHCPITVAESIDDEVAALKAEADENTCREPWSVVDIAEHAKREGKREKAKAKERKAAGQKAGRENKKAGSAKVSHNQPKVRAVDATAAATGVSGKTLEKIEQVYATAEADKTMTPVVAAMEEDDKVDSAHKVSKWSKADRKAHAKLWDWGWSNGEVSRFRDLVEQLPEDEQPHARSIVIGEKSPVPGSYGKKAMTNLISLPETKRASIYAKHCSDDGRDREAATSLAIGNPCPADPRLARIVESAREWRRFSKQWPEEEPSKHMAEVAAAMDAVAEELRLQTKSRSAL